MFTQHDLEKFCENLKNGHVVAAPAEGVYGYCADPFNVDALEELLAIKNRTAGKGFITLIKDWDDLTQLVRPLSLSEKSTLETHWPGQVTVVLPAAEGLPPLLTGGRDTIAVRMPKADTMQDYLHAWGAPLISTSANLSGQPPATTTADLFEGIFSLESKTPLKGGVSTVIDLATGVQLR